MSARLETRLPVRVYNGIASILGCLSSSNLNPEHLLKTAVRKFGLSDFGDDSFREGFGVLCDSLNQEAMLHPFGRLIAKKTLFVTLRNRLELTNCWKRFPESLDASISRPVFIIGLPRTGTTLLFNLMSLDDRFQYFCTWEAYRPGVLTQDEKEIKKTVAESDADINFLNYLRPDLKKIHYTRSDMPEECIPLLYNSCESDFFAIQFKVPSYRDWYFKHDHTESYNYYSKQLKWLQRDKDGGRWLLKAPVHLNAIDTLFETFPDAQVIQTHRDPLDVVSSMGSLMYNYQSMTTYDVCKKKIGPEIVELLSQILHQMMVLRYRNNYNVFDVQYNDLLVDPLKVIDEIYQYLGKPLTDSTRRRLKNYLSEHPKNKYGRHAYTLDEYGLQPEAVFSKFDFYYQRFDFKP